MKKTQEDMVLKLVKNRDILYELGKIKGSRILVGFAAESENLIENAKAKVLKKNLDLIVANDITLEDSGFKSDNNTACIVSRDDTVTQLSKMSKFSLAEKILDKVQSLR
jgi:phosphopantothenoylcysteine decarboxylase/phosphopantothenate--cysteine ligase